MPGLIRKTPSRRSRDLLTIFGAGLCLLLVTQVSMAQRSAQGDNEPAPSFSDFKGVRIGMLADEARKKLGTPRDKSAEQDLYVFDENEAVQVYYDKKGAVSAISIDFMNGATGVPLPKDVLGTNADPKPDGSIYKMVRYPKAGYWVSYNRTSGDAPTITITMQKIP